jgi:glycosyltransferase involved in cell wall biosynthesis
MQLLFIVHRTYPYNGGSEYNIKLISEALANENYNVTVLTDCSNGDYGKVKVINDRNQLFSDQYDWVIIHGNDMPIQDYALLNIQKIKAKTLYWIIKPSDSESAMYGFRYANVIGWGTSYDFNHIVKHKCTHKAKYIRYAVDLNDCVGINTPYNDLIFVSSGGFGAHKGFDELIEIFNDLDMPQTKLVLTGYIGGIPFTQNKNIELYNINNRKDYLNIIASADLYIMNSYSEGFGLVLLDAMINKVPWISRDIAGATDMKQYGNVYSSQNGLKNLLLNYKKDQYKIYTAHQYILNERTIKNMVKDFKLIFI